MRHVAFVALVLLVVLPTGLSANAPPDECKSAASPGCVQVPPAGAVPAPVPATPTYYVYLAAANCVPSNSDSCAGRPLNGAPINVMGVLYQESNTLSGLQRGRIVTPTKIYPPDQAVLL
jgi:hypothetical protein